MTGNLTDEEIVKLAQKRVQDKKDFFVHLAMYVIINLFLFFMWLFITGGKHGAYPWFLWVVLGWGVGVAAHAVSVFLNPKGSSWEQREIQKEIERLKKNMQ